MIHDVLAVYMGGGGSIMGYLVFVVPTILLAMWAQSKVSSTYNKYVRIPSRGQITGAEAAAAVMRNAGISKVKIVKVRGHLTDHYDPIGRKLALSEENYHGTSLAALGVAAHEAGHAVQHKVGYAALKARMALVPITNIASSILPIVMIGSFFIIGGAFSYTLLKLGILCYVVLTVFQLITLPVEYDASARAKKELVALGILGKDEMVGVDKTLNAAALTYVAAFVSSLSYLLYLLSMVAGNRD
ncbi:MAG: zinc metallopeptidase [Verrucomicrobiota bacterium]|nr:zinc metallopeptidase [Verrucomicrobiota bacterium]